MVFTDYQPSPQKFSITRCTLYRKPQSSGVMIAIMATTSGVKLPTHNGCSVLLVDVM